jgi:hypothetical protein
MHKPLRGSLLNASHALARGLASGWIMNEGSGDRLFDSGGRRSHAALINMDPPTDWIGGLRGSALRVVGSSSQHIVAPPTGAFPFPAAHFTLETIALWDGTSAWMSLSGIDDAGSNQYGVYELMRRNDSGLVMLRVYNTTGGSVWGTTPATMVAGRWHHVVAAFDGQAQVYLDGRAGTKSAPLTGTRAAANGPLRIAAENDGGAPAFYWSGGIELFRLWDRALSAAEVAYLGCQPYAMFERARALWTFSGVAPPPPSGPTRFCDRTAQILFGDATDATGFRDASQRIDFTPNVS